MFAAVTKNMGRVATIAAATLALAGCSQEEKQNTASIGDSTLPAAPKITPDLGALAGFSSAAATDLKIEDSVTNSISDLSANAQPTEVDTKFTFTFATQGPESVAKSQEFQLQLNYKVHKFPGGSCADGEGCPVAFTITGEISNPNAATFEDVVIVAVFGRDVFPPKRDLPDQILEIYDDGAKVPNLRLEPRSCKRFTISFETSIPRTASGDLEPDSIPRVSIETFHVDPRGR